MLGVGAATWALASALANTVATIAGPGRTAVDEVVTAVAAAGALALLSWVAFGLLVSVVSTLPGPVGRHARRVRERVAPAAVRRWAGLLLGVTIVGTIAPGGAVAHEISTGTRISAVTQTAARAAALDQGTSAPAPGWPDLPAPPPTAPPTQSPRQAQAPAPEWVPTPVRPQPPVSLTSARVLPDEDDRREVVVRRGDTLWDLAAAHLPPAAGDAEIAGEWQRWYAANRAVIGADPDLILPGQVLRIPDAADAVLSGGLP